MMLQILLLVAFPAMMAFAAASDLLTMTIPNRLAIGLAATFPVVALCGGMGWTAIATHVGMSALVLFVGFLFFARGWIGGGDAKFAAATALWLGTSGLTDYVALAGIAGGILTLAILGLRAYPLPSFAARLPWLQRLHRPDCGVPYGIALAVAALVVYPHSDIWAMTVGTID